MRKFYFFVFVFLTVFTAQSQIINFPDANFKAKLLNSSASNGIAQNLSNQNVAIDTNGDGEIEVSEAQQIKRLYIAQGTPVITSFEGIRNFTNLKNFTASYANTSVFDVHDLVNLEYLSIIGCHITNLDVSGCTGLIEIDCSLNEIANPLSFAGFTNLTSIICNSNDMVSIDASNCSNLVTLKCYQSDYLASINVSGCTALQTLDTRSCQLGSLDVGNLANLVTLDCNDNDPMATLNLSGCTNLVNLYCRNGMLTSLDLSGLSALTLVESSGNQIATINTIGCTSLKTLYSTNNQYTSFDISGLPALELLQLESNQLTSINLASPSLKTLTLDWNALTAIDLSASPALTSASIQHNQFATVDASACSNLLVINVGHTPQLLTLYAKTGRGTLIDIDQCPNFQYACVDESKLTQAQQALNNSGSTTGHVNTYCSFVPGGTYYTMQGTVKFDANQNGCDAGDTTLPNLKLAFVNGINIGNYIPDASGNYHYDV